MIRYAAISTGRDITTAPARDSETHRQLDEAAKLLRGLPAGSHHVAFDEAGKAVLRRGPASTGKQYRSPWTREQATAWADAGRKYRGGWAASKSSPASAEPLPPLGLVILHGAGNVEGNTSGRLRSCSAEYAAPGCFDESVRSIEEGKKRFTLKLHHGGPVLGDSTKGNLRIDARWGASPVAIWEPDSNDIEHRAIVARAMAGALKCSAEFRVLADDVADGVRRLDRVELVSVCLLRSHEIPAYSACLVAPLDRYDMARSLLRLRGMAIMTDKGEA